MPTKNRESLPYSMARFTQTLKRVAHPMIQRARFKRLFGAKDDVGRTSKIRKRLKTHPPVFVYQMGKVASTSIFESLQQSYGGAVFHAHYFDAFHSSLEIRILYDYYRKEKPSIKLISLVREPVTRNISAFFQNFRRDTGIDISKYKRQPAKLRELFLKNYPHEIPWVWFDNNIKKHFGVDVYEHPFPDAGFQFTRAGNVDLLLMRHDLKDSTKQSLIAQHVGLDDFKIDNRNVSSEKQYASLMAEFKQLKLPLWYLYRLSSTRYMKHFYEAEIGQIVREWKEAN